MTIGIQATGKSTFVARELAATHVVISLDVVRTRRREEALVKACLDVGQRLVVDNTNLTVDDRRKYFEWARDARAEVRGYYFQSRVGDALERNELREGKARIPDKGILAACRRLEIPSLDEGFAELHYVQIRGSEFTVSAWDPELFR